MYIKGDSDTKLGLMDKTKMQSQCLLPFTYSKVTHPGSRMGKLKRSGEGGVLDLAEALHSMEGMLKPREGRKVPKVTQQVGDAD